MREKSLLLLIIREAPRVMKLDDESVNVDEKSKGRNLRGAMPGIGKGSWREEGDNHLREKTEPPSSRWHFNLVKINGDVEIAYSLAIKIRP